MPTLINMVATCLGKGPVGTETVGLIEALQGPSAGPGCPGTNKAILQDGFPFPGGKEFCDHAQEITEAFEEIYDKYVKWFTDISPLDRTAASLKLPVGNDAVAVTYNWLFKIWNTIIDVIRNTIKFGTDVLLDIIKNAITLQSCVTKRPHPKAAYGVWAVKQVIHLIESVRAGIDPGIYFTVDIHPQFDTLKQWIDMLERYYTPIEIPSAQEATRSWLLNRITVKQRDCLWLLNGHNPETYKEFAESEREQLDWREAIQYARRTNHRDGNEDDILRARGFVTTEDVRMAQEMFWELPGIADHLHWLQRNVFDARYVEDYRLEEGFDDKFWPTFGPDLTALGMREKYARYHYAAHWIQPSPEQMREMVYRSQEIAALTGKGFTEDDYERILTEQDYSPLARRWFRAIIYQVPAISYIKSMYQQSVITLDELTEYHHRLGYAPKDAERFARIDQIQKDRMRASAAKGWTTGAATSAAISGQITDDQQEEIYAKLGYTSEEATTARVAARASFNGKVVMRSRTRSLSAIISLVSQAVDVGVMSPQAAADNLRISGWPKDQAEGFAGLLSQGGAVRKVKQAITYVRRHVIDGGITFPVAQQELQRLGLTSEATDNYLALWRLQMTPGRKKRTAAQIVADVANRHITTADAINRLVNLGYNDADTRLYLADAQAKLVKTEQGLIAAQQKRGLQAIKEQEKVAKEMQRQRRQLQSDMLKATPVKTLQSWAGKGIISHKRFMSRLMQMGWTRPDAELYYDEACKGKGKACTEVDPHATPANGSGPGGGHDGGGSAGSAGDVPQQR